MYRARGTAAIGQPGQGPSRHFAKRVLRSASALALAIAGSGLVACKDAKPKKPAPADASEAVHMANVPAREVEEKSAKQAAEVPKQRSVKEPALAPNQPAAPPVQQNRSCRDAVADRFDPVLGDRWLPDPEDMYPDPEVGGVRLLAQKYASRIRAKPTTASTVVAYARRGAVLPAIKIHSGRGCSSGQWHEVQGGGFVCSGRDFAIIEGTRQPKPYFLEGHHLPYRYAKFHRGRHPVFSRLPNRKELARVLAVKAKKGKSYPSPVKGVSDGLQFETVVGEHSIRGEKLYQNAKGDWFLARDSKLLNPPVGHGVFLTREITLPLAYIRHKNTPVRCNCDGTMKACGTAQKHDVVTIEPPKAGAKSVRLRGDTEIRVPRGKVRLATFEARPPGIPANAKWIHVRLKEQTLVAYEGDVPVFATIVATGAKGYETPPGTFRTQRKFVSTTMRGQDDEFGRYTVSDVPWTLFYDGSFALHGAYWHDTFGDVRSHGCTNIPPNDARWLFHWTDPALPVGWHGWGGVRDGTYVHVTQD